jgi:DNA adenine methylase
MNASMTTAARANGTAKSHRRGNRLIAFGWYGGKVSHLDWLLPLLPPTEHYCEPFAGSAAVLINRKPSPIETYNDVDGEVVNFFKALRDNREELVQAIGLTPFSKREFELAITEPTENLSSVERARRFYIRARQVRTGLAQTASVGRWAHCTLTSRGGMPGAVCRWLGAIEHLPEIAQRLLRVQFENAPAGEVIRRYDSKDTLFYCDPPYPHKSRGDSKAYGYEMTDEHHRELASLLKSCKGKVAVSSYRTPLNNEIFKGWRCMEAPEKLCHSVKTLRREVLFVNYDPDDMTPWLKPRQTSLL